MFHLDTAARHARRCGPFWSKESNGGFTGHAPGGAALPVGMNLAGGAACGSIFLRRHSGVVLAELLCGPRVVGAIGPAHPLWTRPRRRRPGMSPHMLWYVLVRVPRVVVLLDSPGRSRRWHPCNFRRCCRGWGRPPPGRRHGSGRLRCRRSAPFGARRAGRSVEVLLLLPLEWLPMLLFLRGLPRQLVVLVVPAPLVTVFSRPPRRPSFLRRPCSLVVPNVVRPPRRSAAVRAVVGRKRGYRQLPLSIGMRGRGALQSAPPGCFGAACFATTAEPPWTHGRCRCRCILLPLLP